MHPVIMTEVAAQHILELQAEAARTAKARTAKARTAREDRSPRLGWLFDLADRREAARAAQHNPDFCCPDYLLSGQCAAHAEADRMAAGSGRAS